MLNVIEMCLLVADRKVDQVRHHNAGDALLSVAGGVVELHSLAFFASLSLVLRSRSASWSLRLRLVFRLFMASKLPLPHILHFWVIFTK